MGTRTEGAVSVPRWIQRSTTAADGVIVQKEGDIFHLSCFQKKSSRIWAKFKHPDTRVKVAVYIRHVYNI